MRHLGFVLGAVILLAATASAQVSAGNSGTSARTTLMSELSDAPVPSPLYAVASEPADPADPAAALPAAPSPQVVQSVFQEYNWQAYFGYTFFRFYAAPQLTNNENGLNLAMTYYPGGGRIGLDSEFVGTFGSAYGCTSKFVMAGGGARVRWLTERNVEFWVHGLAGYSHFLPQTAWGGQSAFAYETGAGVDLNVRQKRWALRFAGDMIGSRYFNTNQFSPKFSVGIVIKF